MERVAAAALVASDYAGRIGAPAAKPHAAPAAPLRQARHLAA
jgi:hypothetical protein